MADPEELIEWLINSMYEPSVYVDGNNRRQLLVVTNLEHDPRVLLNRIAKFFTLNGKMEAEKFRNLAELASIANWQVDPLNTRGKHSLALTWPGITVPPDGEEW